MGLELFLSWQALALAAIVVTLTTGVKTVVGLIWKDWRDSRVTSKLVVPSIPLVLGFFAGIFVPLRPEAVVEYVSSSTAGAWSWVAYGAWGFVVGGVAGAWLFDRFKSFLTHGRE